MTDKVAGYRAFPSIPNPAESKVVTQSEFDALDKTVVQEAASVTAGHEGTTIWYAGSAGYVVEVKFNDRAPIRMFSLCTVPPQFGMDRFDGMFAQDVEEYVLWRELSLPTDRLTIFGTHASIEPLVYLRDRGILASSADQAERRPWWKFW